MEEKSSPYRKTIIFWISSSQLLIRGQAPLKRLPEHCTDNIMLQFRHTHTCHFNLFGKGPPIKMYFWLYNPTQKIRRPEIVLNLWSQKIALDNIKSTTTRLETIHKVNRKTHNSFPSINLISPTLCQTLCLIRNCASKRICLCSNANLI